MTTQLFSNKNRPFHLGPYPTERFARSASVDPGKAPPMLPLSFDRKEDPFSIVNAIGEYQAMIDATRGGLTNRSVSTIPSDLTERSRHLKSFGYFSDATMVGMA